MGHRAGTGREQGVQNSGGTTWRVNKAGYTAQDAPSTRLKVTGDGRTDGPTDGHTDGQTD